MRGARVLSRLRPLVKEGEVKVSSAKHVPYRQADATVPVIVSSILGLDLDLSVPVHCTCCHVS